MPFKIKYIAVIILILILSQSAWSQAWNSDQQKLINTIERLSTSTAPNGTGADTYGQILSDDFSRWTVGSAKVNNKTEWVESIREWFEDGWRVADRQVEYIEIVVSGDYAFTRRNVTENYSSPDGESSTSKAAVAETWLRKNGSWFLYRVDVNPISE